MNEAAHSNEGPEGLGVREDSTNDQHLSGSDVTAEERKDHDKTEQNMTNEFKAPINANMLFANAGDVKVHKTEIKVYSNEMSKLSSNEGSPTAEELMSALRKAAALSSSKVSVPVKLKKALVPVPLRMSNAPSRIKEKDDIQEGFARREDLPQIFTSKDQHEISPDDLFIEAVKFALEEVDDIQGYFTRRDDLGQIFAKEDQHDISPDDLFIEAEKFANQEAANPLEDEEARKNFVEKFRKIVAVLGQPGIGKSTFIQFLIRRILAKKFRHRVSYVFHISVRNMDFSSKPKNLLHFLLRSILPSWKHSPETDEALLTAIAEDPYTLIAFDGLDEADVQRFGEKVPNVNMYEESSTWAFLINLISGDLLPLAYKVITSRPSQIYSLHLSKRPLFLAEILGLDSANQIALGKQICGCRYPEIKAVLDRNDNLRAMCYVPVNCILSIAFLLEVKDDLDFVSFTRVLAFTCSRYARSDHLHGSSPDLTKLAKFAWEKYKLKTYRFRASELKEAGLSDETIHAFLHFAVVDSTDLRVTILDGDQLSYFSHLVMHEFFAAAFLMLVMSDEDFFCHLTLLLEDQYEVVARCAFGLCHNTISTHLNPPFQFSSKFLERKEMLKDLAISHLKSNSRSILKVLSWIHEAHDDVITKAFATHLPDQIVLRGSFFPTDSSSLAYVMQASSRRHDVIMTSCEFRGGSFERFARLVAEHNIKIGRLGVGGVPIGNHGLESLTKCVHLIDKLIIDGCRITDVSQLADNISQRSTPLKLIRLGGNAIGNAGVKHLVKCLHLIDELDLNNCGITDVSPLADHLSTPLTMLRLGGNRIANEGFKQLSRCADLIEELYVDSCSITDVSPLADGLSIPMRHLSLGCNPIGNEGVVQLAKCVHLIEELYLNQCGITVLSPMAESISRLLTPIKYLSLGGNQIGNPGVEDLSKCIHRIGELHVERCGITDVSKLAESISQLPTRRRRQESACGSSWSWGMFCFFPLAGRNTTHCNLKLYIEQNEIGDDGVRSFTQCLDKVEKLTLGGWGSGVTTQGKHQMRDKLRILQLPDSRVIFD